jgi:hypothetical protein
LQPADEKRLRGQNGSGDLHGNFLSPQHDFTITASRRFTSIANY